MPEIGFIRIVLDVNIVGSAGYKDSTLSTACRITLAVILSHECFQVVISREIVRELNRALSSELARTWYESMLSQRRLPNMGNHVNDQLRRKVRNLKFTKKQIDAMNKDICYVEAALWTDRRVISRDDEARTCFREAADTIAEIREIMWSNPVDPEDDTENWLRNCTPIEEHRQLGFVPDE